MAASTSRTLWIGTYPASGRAAGTGEGIWRVEVSPGGEFGSAELAAVTPAPSFLALHPSGRTLYAVGEVDAGTVTAFPVGGQILGAPVTIGSGGASPCHVLALDDAVWIANYGDGAAAVARVDAAGGAFLDDAVHAWPTPSGTGTHPERQEGPHAHFSAVVGDDVVVADLGLDTVRRYPAQPWLPDAATAPLIAAALPPGTGPRHLVALPDGSLVVAGELDARLHVLAPVAGTAAHAWVPSSAAPATRSAGGSTPLPSHLTVTGDLLLLGVRGADVLAAHRVVTGPGGAPVVETLGEIGLGEGAWPRHHQVVGAAPDGRLLVVVANQGRNELAAVLVDPATGAGQLTATLPLPTPPACVVVA